jgi:hypothetical protein
MKNKNLILLLAAGAAYWYFFMYKKKLALPVSQPGMPDVPAKQSATQMQPVTESVTILDQIKTFSEPTRQLEHKQDESFINFNINQVSGVKRVGVPYTI